jgi:hypothetical protein
MERKINFLWKKLNSKSVTFLKYWVSQCFEISCNNNYMEERNSFQFQQTININNQIVKDELKKSTHFETTIVEQQELFIQKMIFLNRRNV